MIEGVLPRNLARRAAYPIILGILSATATQGPAYSDDAVREFTEGGRKTFSTKAHPKAKGAYLTVEYPSSWSARESKRPNIVQTFTSKDGRGLETFSIIIKALPKGLTLRKQDKDAFLSPSTLREGIPTGALFIDARPATIEGAPAGILEYRIIGNRAGIKALVDIWAVNFFYDNTFVQFQFGVGGRPAQTAELSQRVARFKPLFKLIANSIVFPEKWSGNAKPDNTEPIREPMPVNFRVICNNDYVKEILKNEIAKQIEKNIKITTAHRKIPVAELFLYASQDLEDRINPDGWSLAIVFVSNIKSLRLIEEILKHDELTTKNIKNFSAAILQEHGFLKYLNVAHTDKLDQKSIQKIISVFVSDFSERVKKYSK